MLSGTSLLYVDQGVGKAFKPGVLCGYFNDLTEKVLKDPDTLMKGSLPSMQNERGESIVFATTIFQYGLGCYDLLLLDNKEEYLSQFIKCVDWAVMNQDSFGGWDVSAFAGIDSRYGAMAQAEGCSLLLRAYVLLNEDLYLERAKKAIDLMLRPIEKGGTALYHGNDLILLEFTNTSVVLNGWIFSLFGIYDYYLVTKDHQYFENLQRTLNSLKSRLCDFDTGFWSKYNLNNSIASPFYHKLHISQLEALSMIDSDIRWITYKDLFESYQNSKIKRSFAILVKVLQKVFGE